MRFIRLIPLVTLFVSGCVIAGSQPVTLVGGFVAVGHPAIATGPEGQTFTYGVRGGMILEMPSGQKIKLSIDCTGIDSVGKGQQTDGHGHCVWRDGDDDQLFVSLKTIASGNRYSITGGTGKWRASTGSIDTTFTYLPAPAPELFLGVEEGSGHLEPRATDK
ncbi:MAG: hypothetical protein HOB98_20805 [Gammaproteobacteria bacterium]|nr:hypothetical protein [Gammaproteobacteria bacterium]MBT3870494.1 hypothetical protein [Gammaproteobacteria bacterium]MBT4381127.1 hypothetical protein [Gammaproteobacteria bacterium]MBT4618876.1 hypothetical protein [Gammaproteobacteria bacterium]MBT5195959.1 hypothetical protein [Gammaproteobacteria bacterium]